MSTKNQSRSRHKVQKISQDEDEIIEIEEIPSLKQIKIKPNLKHKENTENSSSEATSSNKKKAKKKKDEVDLIEIMDVEIPEVDLVKKKITTPSYKQKKSVSNLSSIKEKQKDKLSVQSVNKIDVNKKSPNKGKKLKHSATISLNESEGNESEIKVTTQVKIENSNCKRRSTSKTPRKKNINSNKEIALNQEKKIKKNVEKNEKKYKKINQEIELLSDESENNKKKEGTQKRKKNKKSNDLTPYVSSDDLKTGYLSSRKVSRKKGRNLYEKEDLKSKSTIKISLKEDKIKKKIGNLLGRKRKADRKNLKSLTPNKKTNKSESKNEKSSTQIINNKTPSQNKGSKVKSKTPFKNIGKKNNKGNNLFSHKMEIDEKNSKNNDPEFSLLEELVNNYGLERVLDSLCSSKLNQKSKLDSCIKGLKKPCIDNKINLFVCKMLFSYFESKFIELEKSIQNKKRSTSVSSLNQKKNRKTNSEISTSNLANIDSKSVLSIMDQSEGESPIQIDDEEIQESKKAEDNEKDKSSLEKNKSKNIRNAKEEHKKPAKRLMSIGSHYNKNEEGHIFKYQVASLDGKGNAIFKCYDDKCCGMGIYELETRKFKVTKKHNVKHAEHEYIINYDKDGEEIFKQLKEKNKSDAQVFKENGERIVKYY